MTTQVSDAERARDRAAMALVNAERAEHRLAPCALTDLTEDDMWRYRSRADAVLLALRDRPTQGGVVDTPCFERGFKAGLQYAASEGWAYLPDDLEQSVLAGNASLRAGEAAPIAGDAAVPAGFVRTERTLDDDCGCPEEYWNTPFGLLHMHLSAGKASNALLDNGDEGERSIDVTTGTVDEARAAIFGWANMHSAARGVAGEAAPVVEGKTVPRPPKGASISAVNCATGAWHYVNHAQTWQTMPNPLSTTPAKPDETAQGVPEGGAAYARLEAWLDVNYYPGARDDLRDVASKNDTKGVPERCRLVPIEPTAEMIHEGKVAQHWGRGASLVHDVWSAMLSTAPHPEERES